MDCSKRPLSQRVCAFLAGAFTWSSGNKMGSVYQLHAFMALPTPMGAETAALVRESNFNEAVKQALLRYNLQLPFANSKGTMVSLSSSHVL